MKKEIEQSIFEKKNEMKVLLVDDNPINLIIATEMLLQLSIQITTAENGVEALAFLEKDSFDLILMDLQMPQLGGIEATKIIRKKLKNNTPVIAMTAHVSRKEREKCFAAGMNEFVSRPVERDYLFSLIDKYYCSKSEKSSATVKMYTGPEISKIQLDGIDIADAVKRLSCDYKLFSEVLDNFCIFYLNITRELRTLLSDGNHAELRREVHSLKGAASNVSAVLLYNSIKELEEALKKGCESLYENLIGQIDIQFKDVVKSNELLKSHINSNLSSD